MILKFLRRSFFYLGADILSRLTPFLILPYIANELGPVNFGEYSLLITLVSTALILVGFSTHQAVNIAFFRKKGVWIRLASSLVTCWSILTLFALFLFLFLFWNRDFVFAVVVSIACAYCGWIFQLLITALHFSEKIYSYFVAQLFRSFFIAGLPGLAVYYKIHDANLVFLSFAASHVLMLILSFFILGKLGVRVDLGCVRWRVIKWSHQFSFPSVITGMSGWARASFDRYILIFTGASSALGIYSLGFQFGSILGIVGLSLSKVSSNYVLKTLSSKAASRPDRVAEAMRIIAFFSGINFIFLLSFVFFIYRYSGKIFHGGYSDSLIVALIVGGAFSLQSVASLVTPCFQYMSKGYFLGKLAVFLSVFSLLLVYPMILVYSYLGAAISFLIVWCIHCGILLVRLRGYFRIWATT